MKKIIKKFGICMSACIIAMSSYTGILPTIAATNQIAGDANGDGKINIIDYVFMKRYVSGVINTLPVSDTLKALDLNSDEQVNGTDVLLLKNFIMNIIDKFPLINNSQITPTDSTFDKNIAKQADLNVTITLNGNTLTTIKNGATDLVLNKDYTATDNIVTVSKSYLSTLVVGSAVLTFSFSAGKVATTTINVSDTTPAVVVSYPNQSVKIENFNKGLNLNILGFANNSSVNVWKTNGESNERWRFSTTDGQYFKITNEKTSLVLSPLDWSVTKGNTCVIYSDSNRDEQLWQITGADKDVNGDYLTYKIVNKTNTSIALIFDATTGKPMLGDYTGDSTQKWKLVSDGLVGFAGFAKDLNGKDKTGTIGGLLGKTVFVNTLAELKDALLNTNPLTIVIASNIDDCNSEVYDLRIASDKTIIGSYDAKRLTDPRLRTDDYLKVEGVSNNIIIKNVDIEVKNREDVVAIAVYGSRNIWIDHCTFNSTLPIDVNEVGKFIWVNTSTYSNTDPDYVTVSYNKFYHRYWTVAFGTTTSLIRNNATVMLNYFDSCVHRTPQTGNGRIHVLNNLIQRSLPSTTNDGYMGIIGGPGAAVYSDSNRFDNFIKESSGYWDTELTVDANASVKDVNSYTNKGETAPTSIPYLLPTPTGTVTTFDPSTKYSYSAIKAYSNNEYDVKDFCTTYTGAVSSSSNLKYSHYPEIKNSQITPTASTFDKNVAKQADLNTTITLNGHTLLDIKNGTTTLVVNKDYTITDNIVTINKSYLSTLPIGSAVITFNFSFGKASNTITIADSTATPTTGRQMEKLDRGLIATKVSNGVYVGWRLLGTESTSIAFNLYRDGTKLNSTPITTSTNYLDTSGTLTSTYYVQAVLGGIEQTKSSTTNVLSQNYLSVPLKIPAGGTTPDGVAYTYSANDSSVGDVDGDGQYEIIVKWDPSNSKDNSLKGYTGNVYLDAYKLNGTMLWRIDLGKNIRAGAHYTQFMVYDLDGDGKAEVACKTADGTTDGAGTVIGSKTADYRNSSGYILSGPEYLTVFEGLTGKILTTINYEPARGTVSSWGDSYGNRVDRFLACIAYLDGKTPSLVMCRGYYTRTVLVAYNFKNKTLTKQWTFDSNTTGNSAYAGQGNHNLSVGDIDGDSKDEIVYGACAIDDNGTAMYTTNLGHGDAMHFGDLDPDRAGLEVFVVHEDKPSTELHDAKTGKIIWKVTGAADVGRGLCADIDPTHKGEEMWSSDSYTVYNSKGTPIVTTNRPSYNAAIWWDGDLLRELLDSNKVDKWNYTTNKLGNIFSATECTSNNTTKSNACLQVDLFGDWREEVIWKTADSSALHIYTTTAVTSNRIYTLMHDPIYRLGVAWENVAYNQPPHTGFYLGDGMATAPVPNIYYAGQ